MDFETILAGINAGTLFVVVISAAAVLGLVGFASWGARKVGGFFGGGVSSDMHLSDSQNPAINRELFAQMAADEKRHGSDLPIYSDAQVAAYRETFDRMSDAEAESYGAYRSGGETDNERELRENDPEMWEASQRYMGRS